MTVNPGFVRGESGATSPVAAPHLWVPAEKPAGVRRVVLLGGAGAAGVPLTDYHVGRLLEARWRNRFPSEPIEVVSLAMDVPDPVVLREAARQGMSLGPDALVVCGSAVAATAAGHQALADEVRAGGGRLLFCILPDAAGGDNKAKVAAATGAGVVDLRPRLRVWERGEGDVGGLFPDGVHLTFTGRAVAAEGIADGLASMWGLAAGGAEGETGAMPADLRGQLARDVMFNGYDEHDMWNWALREAAAKPDAQDGVVSDLQIMAEGMRRRAVLGWDTTDLVVAYERALLQNPDDPLTHFTAARLLGVRGEGERAEAAFQDGFRLMPLHPEARLNHAAMQMARGDREAARASLDILRKWDPGAAGLARMESALAMREGDAEAAAAHLESHLAGAPDDAAAWLMLSDLQAHLGRDEAAASSRDRAQAAAGR